MNADPLFRIAAIFNFVVAGPLLLAYPQVAPLLGIEGPPTVWFHITVGIVIVFGYAYWCISRDPHHYRPYVSLGAIGKLTFAAVIYTHWLNGTAPGMLALLVTSDVVFAALFVAYLRAHPATRT
jgi:hypothetical protein